MAIPQGFILVYSVVDRESFHEVTRVRTYIERMRSHLSEKAAFVLVGTFADCQPSERQVTEEEGKDLAITLGCPFFEVCTISPDDEKNGHLLFFEIIRQLYFNHHAKVEGVKPQLTALTREARTSRDYRYSRTDLEDIKFSSRDSTQQPQIRAATIEKLVERLTYEKYPDPNMVTTFLLTYRSFMTPSELLSQLDRRYSLSPPNGVDRGEWVKNVQTPIRLR